MSTVVKDLGAVSAYAYAVEKGYTGTEAEFAELMASYADVGQTAVDAKDAAVAAKAAAQTAATTATNKASEAATSAQTATTKAGEATTAAGTATTAKNDAVAAKTAAETAQGKAEDAQAAAESVAESIPSDYSQLSEDVSDLKEGLSSITEKELSANLLNPNAMVSGTIGATGNLTDNSDYVTSDYIAIEDTDTVYAYMTYNGAFSASSRWRFSFYNASKVFISRTGLNQSSAVAPENSAYVRCTVASAFWEDGKSYYGIYLSEQTSLIEYSESSVIATDKVVTKSIADGAVTASKLADDSVTADKIALFVHDNRTDYIDHNKDSAGYIKSTGAFKADASFMCSDFVPLESGKTYYATGIYGPYTGFYDADKALVSYGLTTGTRIEFVMPTGAVYARFSRATADHDFYVSEETGIPFPYGLMSDDSRNSWDEVIPTNYAGMDICTFNKILCIGDSLTEGAFNNDQSSDVMIAKRPLYSYPTQLQKMTGVTCVNMGDSGIRATEWYATYGSQDLSGYDCAIIQLGVNDQAHDGTWNETVAQAFTNIINKLKTDNNGIKIFVANIAQAYSYGRKAAERTYAAAMLDYVNGLNDDNVIGLDMNHYSHLAESDGYNAGHLTAYGYWRLAKDYIAYISWHMMRNKDKYRFIQFIGTDCTYNGTGPTTGEI